VKYPIPTHNILMYEVVVTFQMLIAFYEMVN